MGRRRYTSLLDRRFGTRRFLGVCINFQRYTLQKAGHAHRHHIRCIFGTQCAGRTRHGQHGARHRARHGKTRYRQRPCRILRRIARARHAAPRALEQERIIKRRRAVPRTPRAPCTPRPPCTSHRPRHFGQHDVEANVDAPLPGRWDTAVPCDGYAGRRPRTCHDTHCDKARVSTSGTRKQARGVDRRAAAPYSALFPEQAPAPCGSVRGREHAAPERRARACTCRLPVIFAPCFGCVRPRGGHGAPACHIACVDPRDAWCRVPVDDPRRGARLGRPLAEPKRDVEQGHRDALGPPRPERRARLAWPLGQGECRPAPPGSAERSRVCAETNPVLPMYVHFFLRPMPKRTAFSRASTRTFRRPISWA